MKQSIQHLLSYLLLAMMTGCSGDNNVPMEQNDSVVLNDTDQCTVPEPDFAAQLFTESDRQWFCSVTAANVDTTDEVYFTRTGQAETTRFGQVYWNRSLDDQSLNIASVSVTPFVIRNIVSFNTVLTFDLVNFSGDIEMYDCVLIGREARTPELI